MKAALAVWPALLALATGCDAATVATTTLNTTVEGTSPHADDNTKGWILVGVIGGLLTTGGVIATASEEDVSAYLEQHRTDIRVA